MITIGRMSISVVCVDEVTTRTDGGGEWLAGKLTVERSTCRRGRDELRQLDVPVGCWSDTDDDHDSWSAAHEGFRAITACLGVPADARGPGHPIFEAFFADAQNLGREICGALRHAVASDTPTIAANA